MFKINELDNVNKQFRFILINIFVFFLPFERFYTTLLIYPILLLTIIDFRRLNYKLINKEIVIFQTVWLLSFLGYFLSQDQKMASFILEKQLMIFVLPIILPLAFDITYQNIKKIMISLIFGSTVAVFVLISYMYFEITESNESVDSIFSEKYFNHNFSSPLSVHPTYLSLYLNLSLVGVLYWYRELTKVLDKILSIIVATFLFTGIIFLSSRNVTISSVIVILILLYPLFKNKLYYLTGGLVLTITLISLIFSNSYLKERFSSQFFDDISGVRGKEVSTLEPRNERWNLGIELVKESPFFGHGTGDEVLELRKKYKENKMFISYIENFNIHNQYLSILIKHGIIGFIIFILSLYYYIRIAIKTHNLIYLFFLGVLLLTFCTENILDSNKGIFYFAFFNTVLGSYSCRLIRQE